MDHNLFLSCFAFHVCSKRRLLVPVCLTFRTHAVLFTVHTVRSAHSIQRPLYLQHRAPFRPYCTSVTVQFSNKVQCLCGLYKVHKTLSETRYELYGDHVRPSVPVLVSATQYFLIFIKTD